MSQSEIARFHHPNIPSHAKDPEAADKARQRIAELPDQYLAHATPTREELVGAVHPVSPAAEGHESTHSASAIKSRLNIMAAGRKNHLTPHPESQIAKTTTQVAGAAPAQPAPSLNPLASQSATASESASAIPGASKSPEVGTASPQPKRGLPSRLKPIITGLVTFALLFFIFKSPIFLNQLGYLTAKPATNSTTADGSAQVPPNPLISIPKINVSAPIVFAASNQESAIQKDLEGGVVHYANTAQPGENGNTVIFGHSSNDWWEPGNYKFVFVLLDKLAVGDTFTVNYQSKQYLYQVAETKVVEPTDLSVLSATPDPEITLITCTPPGTSWKRLIVRAKQISPAPETAKTVVKSEQSAGAGSLPGNSPSLTDQIGKWWESFTGIFRHQDKAQPTPPSGTLPDAQ